MRKLTLIVTGDRDWDDSEAIEKCLKKLQPSLVIQGGARGADLLALQACVDLRINVITIFAKWNTFGNRAGPIRNREMLRLATSFPNPQVLAFHDDLKSSKGTKDMVKLGKTHKLKVQIYKHPKEKT